MTFFLLFFHVPILALNDILFHQAVIPFLSVKLFLKRQMSFQGSSCVILLRVKKYFIEFCSIVLLYLI